MALQRSGNTPASPPFRPEPKIMPSVTFEGLKMAQGKIMARKYSKGAQKKVKKAMHERKKGTLRSGQGGKGGKVKSRKQAIAIGLSEARAEGKKVPPKKSASRRRR